MIVTFEQVNRGRKQHGPYSVYCSIIHICCLKCFAELVCERTYEQDVCKVQVEHVKTRLSNVTHLVVLLPSFTSCFLRHLCLRSVYYLCTICTICVLPTALLNIVIIF